jgi:hypothetical protein
MKTGYLLRFGNLNNNDWYVLGLTLTYTFDKTLLLCKLKNEFTDTIDTIKLPNLAIIMDGNGRWQNNKGFKSIWS